MPRTYAVQRAKLSPARLPSKTVTAVGRLIRACAELEDLVTLYLCGLARVEVGPGMALLGRSGMSGRLSVADYLSQTRGKSHLHKKVFDKAFRDFIQCRNTVAHGALLGKTPGGKFAFLTSDTVTPTGEAVLQKVLAYSHREIVLLAERAEFKIPPIEKQLSLRPLRMARRDQPLEPHPNPPKKQPRKKAR